MMTHRGRQNKRDRVLRYLDLSFEGRQQNQNNGNVPRSSTRIQGGSKSGRRPTPQPRLATKKAVDYTAQLEADIQRLLEGEKNGPSASPGRSYQVPREPPSSPEPSFSPNHSMAYNKEGQNGFQYNRTSPSKPGKRSDMDERPLHRQNNSHRYLIATEKRPKTAGYEGEHRLGRPTRTTLLRARQRCNSAPVSAYDSRKEIQKRASQRAELQKQATSTYNHSLTDLLSSNVPPGESLRGYLIGARYNRAHHVDDKSLKEYGVYIPRNTNGNPPNCFVIKRMKLKQREPEQQDQEATSPPTSSIPKSRLERPATARQRFVTSSPPSPCSPPPSPRVKYSSSSRSSDHPPLSSRSAENHPSLVITPQPCSRSASFYSSRQAWSDKARIEINGLPTQETDKDKPVPSVSLEVGSTSDGISIQGVGFVGSPPKIARPMTSRARQSVNKSSNSGPDAEVMIQGRSLQTFTNSSVTSLDNGGSWVPRPVNARIPRPKTAVNRQIVSARDVSDQLQQEAEQVGGDPPDLHSAPATSPEVPLDMPAVDNSEVMSVGSEDDSAHRMSAPSPSPAASPRLSALSSPVGSPRPEVIVSVSEQPIVDQENSVDMDSIPEKNDIPLEEAVEKDSSSDGKSDKLTPIISRANRAQSARVKKSRVRFADEIGTNSGSEHSESEKLEQVPVFITEEKNESVVSDGGVEQVSGSALEQEPDPETASATLEDAGDMVENSGQNIQNDSAALSDDLSLKDGSGDFHLDEEGTDKPLDATPGVDMTSPSLKVSGLLNTPPEDNDDGSVFSDDQHGPREVISVDITTKTSTENKPPHI